MTDSNTSGAPRNGLWVVGLCLLAIVADGYDLIVYGATVPSLLKEPGWELSKTTAGAIGSWTLVGLMVGFLTVGRLADLVGRRRLMLIGVTWFSLASVACGFATSPLFMGVGRFLAGIGLGGVLPLALMLAMEFAPRDRRQLYNGLTMSGYAVGTVICSLLALQVIPAHGWRPMYYAAGAFLLIVPLMWFHLPESVSWLVSKNRMDEARVVSQRYAVDLDAIVSELQAQRDLAQGAESAGGYRAVFSQRYWLATVMFIVASMLINIVIYGLNTWLPEIMRSAGYSLGSALQFMLVMQVGTLIGLVGWSALADRFTPRRVIAPAYFLGFLALVVMSFNLPAGLLMLTIGIAGIGTVGANVMTYGFIGAFYPVALRGTALGVAIGLGRFGSILGPMLGAWVLNADLGTGWSFASFAIPTLVLVVVTLLIPKSPAEKASRAAAPVAEKAAA
ncbi:aromatic acid/H+ symport family MFS transporter [Tsukamurella sp. NPDC003166]|uniref:MFS transporter n=1 Tax=Tsukamurella sp. NPDC003166 TaxID=3154444 RepID=UPI0033B060CC